MSDQPTSTDGSQSTPEFLRNLSLKALLASASRLASDGLTALTRVAARGREEYLQLVLHVGRLPRNVLRARCSWLPQAMFSEEGRPEWRTIWLRSDQGQRERGATSVHIAAGGGNVRCVKMLLLSGASINSAAGPLMETPLHLACLAGNKEMVMFLLSQGAKVNTSYTGGETPLHYSLLGKHTECVQLLLEKGADVNISSQYPSPYAQARFVLPGRNQVYGERPLHYAASSGSACCVKLLLRHGANVHLRGNLSHTALHRAVGSVDCMQLLLASGAQINASNDFGMTALSFAVRRGHGNSIQFLLGHGATLDAEVSDSRLGIAGEGAGKTSLLHMSVSYGDPVAVGYLLQYGADVNATDGMGRTALMRSDIPVMGMEQQVTECVRLMTYRPETRLNHQDSTGRTALHWWAERGFDQAVRIILEAGANPAVCDAAGCTALDVSRRETVKFLLSSFSGQ